MGAYMDGSALALLVIRQTIKLDFWGKSEYTARRTLSVQRVANIWHLPVVCIPGCVEHSLWLATVQQASRRGFGWGKSQDIPSTRKKH